MSKAKIDINKHISELLFSYDCVIIPDFGGFVTNYKSASLSDDGKFLIPPSKSISFNKNLCKNDGLLTNFIAEKNSLDYNVAKQYVADYVSSVFLALDNNQKFIFDKIGDFIFDKSLNIIFEPNLEENYLQDSFGLSVINFPVLDAKISKSIEEKGGLQKVFLSSTAKKIYLLVPIIFLLSIISTQTNLLNKLSFNKSSILSVETGVFSEKKSDNIVERKIDSMTKKENALFYKEPKFVVPKHYDSLVIQFMEDNAKKQKVTNIDKTKEVTAIKEVEKPKKIKKAIITEKTIIKGKFILVSGSYKTTKNANKRIKELSKKGFSAELIKYKGGYRISVASFNDKAFAKKESKRFKKELEINSWVAKR